MRNFVAVALKRNWIVGEKSVANVVEKFVMTKNNSGLLIKEWWEPIS